MPTLTTKQKFNEVWPKLEAARRNEIWEDVVIFSRLVAHLAHVMDVEKITDETGTVNHKDRL